MKTAWNKGLTKETSNSVKKYADKKRGKKRPVFTKEWRINMSKAMIGKKHITKEGKKRLSLSHQNEKNAQWKGSNVGYSGLHLWIQRKLGKARKCLNGCISKRYVWANISGEYKRELSDYRELCQNCNLHDGIKKHRKYKK